MSKGPTPSDVAAAYIQHGPYRVGYNAHGHGYPEARGHGAGGQAPKRVIVGYGFWIFLLSDIVMFSGFFAAYAVLVHATAGGPTGRELFDLKRVAIETACLLASSFTCGLGYVAATRKRQLETQFWMLVTGLLGLVFVILEVLEFYEMIVAGAGPQRSAFLSAFFALVVLSEEMGTLQIVGGIVIAPTSRIRIHRPRSSRSRIPRRVSTISMSRSAACSK